MLRIGMCFAAGDMHQWWQLIANSLRREHTSRPGLGVELIECSTVERLKQAAPNVIVGHESDALVGYLQLQPKSLQWLQLMSAGADRVLHVIGNGLVPFRITTVRGIHGVAMREYALTALLYLNKNIERWQAQKETRSWDRASMNIVAGQTAVIVGTGAIGSAIADGFRSLGLRTIGVSRSGSRHDAFDIVHPVSEIYEALHEADCIVIAIPLTPETRGLIDQKCFASMRRRPILINIARGEVVDEHALCEAIECGIVSGAALDAFSTEPLPHTSPLWSLPNVLITPHIAGRFDGGRAMGAERFVQNFIRFVEGKEMIGEVVVGRGY